MTLLLLLLPLLWLLSAQAADTSLWIPLCASTRFAPRATRANSAGA